MNNHNIQRRQNGKAGRRSPSKNAVLWAQQFTKRLLVLCFAGWVIGGIYGMIYEVARLCIAPEMANIEGLLVYFAVPLTCGIPSYIIPNLFLKKTQVQCGIDPEAPHSNYESAVETIVE